MATPNSKLSAVKNDSQSIETFPEVMRAKVPIEFMAVIEERASELDRARSILAVIGDCLELRSDDHEVIADAHVAVRTVVRLISDIRDGLELVELCRAAKKLEVAHAR